MMFQRCAALSILIAATLFYIESTPAEALPATAKDYRGLGFVVVSPNAPEDGGDFGPNTASTKTAGLQEAINHAREIQRDVYIVGGGAKEAFKNPVVYTMTETLRIPWMQDFRLDSGNAVIQYNGQGEAIVFDSQMSCSYRFGLVVSAAHGPVVRLAPQTKGPDNFSVITACKFEFVAIVGAGSVFSGEGATGRGTGLWFDAAQGPIDGNEFHLTELIACETGIRMDEGSTNNWIRCPFLHLCNTHLVIGQPGSTRARLNRIEAFIDGAGIPGNSGVLVHGQHNQLNLSFGSTADKRNLVLAPGATQNLMSLLNLPNGLTDESGGKNRISAPE